MFLHRTIIKKNYDNEASKLHREIVCLIKFELDLPTNPVQVFQF